MKTILMSFALIAILFLEGFVDTGAPRSPADEALLEKYGRISSALRFRSLSTFKAQDLPHLTRVMGTADPDEDDKKLMESMEYLNNLV